MKYDNKDPLRSWGRGGGGGRGGELLSFHELTSPIEQYPHLIFHVHAECVCPEPCLEHTPRHSKAMMKVRGKGKEKYKNESHS